MTVVGDAAGQPGPEVIALNSSGEGFWWQRRHTYAAGWSLGRGSCSAVGPRAPAGATTHMSIPSPLARYGLPLAHLKYRRRDASLQRVAARSLCRPPATTLSIVTRTEDTDKQGLLKTCSRGSRWDYDEPPSHPHRPPSTREDTSTSPCSIVLEPAPYDAQPPS